MPLLLEDLAGETSACNRRIADRLDAEARALRVLERDWNNLRQRVTESALQATDFAIASLAQAEASWRLVIGALREKLDREIANRLVHAGLKVFESGLQLVEAACALGGIAKQIGTSPARSEDLAAVKRRFQELAREGTLALAHRADDWQPVDPTRLALGLQLARVGKTVTAEDARKRFRATGV